VTDEEIYELAEAHYSSKQMHLRSTYRANFREYKSWPELTQAERNAEAYAVRCVLHQYAAKRQQELGNWRLPEHRDGGFL
jgi:ABC-type arginine transport system ATPase subunit